MTPRQEAITEPMLPAIRATNDEDTRAAIKALLAFHKEHAARSSFGRLALWAAIIAALGVAGFTHWHRPPPDQGRAMATR